MVCAYKLNRGLKREEEQSTKQKHSDSSAVWIVVGLRLTELEWEHKGEKLAKQTKTQSFFSVLCCSFLSDKSLCVCAAEIDYKWSEVEP